MELRAVLGGVVGLRGVQNAAAATRMRVFAALQQQPIAAARPLLHITKNESDPQAALT